jgi:FixJ family two-component response regulator
MVYIQKDSPSERDAIGEVLVQAALEAQPVETPAEMLKQLDPKRPACLIADLPTVQSPTKRQFNGLPLEWLETPVEPGQALEDSHTLVICAACLTEMGCTFRHESIGFLKRPFTRAQLLDATLDALACDLAHREKSRQHVQVMERIGTLTGREHQVMDLIYEGLPNKTIAGHLNLSTRTVEASRAAVYRKLSVDSGIALVRLLARMDYEVNSKE